MNTEQYNNYLNDFYDIFYKKYDNLKIKALNLTKLQLKNIIDDTIYLFHNNKRLHYNILFEKILLLRDEFINRYGLNDNEDIRKIFMESIMYIYKKMTIIDRKYRI
jgi:hypothetical protein